MDPKIHSDFTRRCHGIDAPRPNRGRVSVQLFPALCQPGVAASDITGPPDAHRRSSVLPDVARRVAPR